MEGAARAGQARGRAGQGWAGTGQERRGRVGHCGVASGGRA